MGMEQVSEVPWSSVSECSYHAGALCGYAMQAGAGIS
jgi:hypothetical protein